MTTITQVRRDDNELPEVDSEWAQEQVPAEFTKRVIIKKSNREVNLLSITIMIVGKIIMQWTTAAVNATLRGGRSDDVSVMMNLFGQCPK